MLFRYMFKLFQPSKMTTTSISYARLRRFGFGSMVGHGSKTYHLPGNPGFSSMVLDGFLCFSMALRMMVLQFLLVQTELTLSSSL